MSHEAYEDLISAQLDGELTSEEAAQLEAHLAQCPQCRRAKREMETVHRLLLGAAAVPPADMEQRILAGLDAPRAVTPRLGRRVAPWIAAAAVVALVVLGVVKPQFPSQGNRTDEVQAEYAIESAEESEEAAETGGADRAETEESALSEPAAAESAPQESASPQAAVSNSGASDGSSAQKPQKTSSTATKPANGSQTPAATKPSGGSQTPAASKPSGGSQTPAATKPANGSQTPAATKPANGGQTPAATKPANGSQTPATDKAETPAQPSQDTKPANGDTSSSDAAAPQEPAPSKDESAPQEQEPEEPASQETEPAPEASGETGGGSDGPVQPPREPSTLTWQQARSLLDDYLGYSPDDFSAQGMSPDGRSWLFTVGGIQYAVDMHTGAVTPVDGEE